MEITRRELLASAGIIAIGLSGCSGSNQEVGSVSKNKPEKIEVDNSEPSDLEVVESGFSVSEFGTVNYAAIIENPNSKWAAEQINVTATARDESGNVVDTSSDHITLLFANGVTAICGSMYPDVSVSSVDFQVSVPKGGWTQEDLQMDDFLSALPITGVNETTDEYGRSKVSGEIQNETEGTFSLTRIYIVMRNESGEIVYGSYTYIHSDLTPGLKAPFSIDAYDAPQHSSVEAYVDCGWPVEE